jgi:hypothetical protein
MVSGKCLSPHKALAASIRTIRTSSGLAARAGLGVVLLGLGSGRRRDANVIHAVGITPHIPLDTGIRAISKPGGIDPFGGMGVVLLCL